MQGHVAHLTCSDLLSLTPAGLKSVLGAAACHIYLVPAVSQLLRVHVALCITLKAAASDLILQDLHWS